MGFFDDIGKKLSETGQNIARAAQGTSETLRLNNMISDEEKRIINLFTEMGKMYFELHENSYEPNFEQMIFGIKDAQAKIKNYSEQVQKLKGLISCPRCGSEIPENTCFCSVCGLQINAQPAQPTMNNNVVYCTDCGTPLGADVSFCTKCGKPVGSANPAPTVQNTAPATKTCPVCNKETNANAPICSSCGAYINY